MNQELRILLLEDRDTDAELVSYELRRQGINFQVKRVVSEADFLHELAAFQPDLILADYTLPAYNGLSALASVRQQHPEMPFIFVSGTLGEETAIGALHQGATDYVLKQRMSRLGPAVWRALREAEERRQRQRAEKHINELNLLLRAIRGINRLIVHQREPQVLLANACKILVQTRGYLFAWIGLAEAGSKRLLPAAHAGQGAGYLEAVTITWDETPIGQGPAGTAMRSGKPCVCSDVATDAQFVLWKERALARGFASVAAIPMVHGARVLGVLAVYGERPQVFLGEEISLLNELATDLAFALQSIEDEKERRRAEEALREASQFNEQVIASAQEGIVVHDRDLRYRVWNHYMERLTGIPADQVVEKHPKEVFPFLEERGVLQGLEKALAGETTYAEFAFQIERTGVAGWAADRSGPLRDSLGQIIGVIAIVRDITERKALEAQLRQAQKMEAIGQLAGGVAHDFNNLLAVMRGYADLLVMDAEDLKPEAEEGLKQIILTVERAANLIRQLLVFSRKQTMQAQPLALNGVISEVTKMLKRIIGEHIDLECRCGEGLPLVQADVGMMEQVLVNLTINARDAMPQGGRLLIATRPVSLDPAQVRANPEARPGEFVGLTVQDNGAGIAPEHLPRIFEPFFTTKEPGKGTGLGLATVYGIIKQHQGWIEVSSQPGTGTTFNIFLPALPAAAGPVSQPSAPTRLRGGTETILLVEDELAVRAISRRVLKAYGYKVLEASSAPEALQIWQAQADHIALLLTDIILPQGLTGRDLAERLWASRPQLKTIFMSGYSSEVAGKDKEFIRRTGSRFLQKPCPAPTLIATVRECLDALQP